MGNKKKILKDFAYLGYSFVYQLATAPLANRFAKKFYIGIISVIEECIEELCKKRQNILGKVTQVDGPAISGTSIRIFINNLEKNFVTTSSAGT